jgi:hypothetical protein
MVTFLALHKASPLIFLHFTLQALMKEIILNIYLIVNDDYVREFKAVAYEFEGTDEEKIQYLKKRAPLDLTAAFLFEAPSDRNGNFMKYRKFARLEERGRQFELFEEIFKEFHVPQNPLICVTPVVDGKIYSSVQTDD